MIRLESILIVLIFIMSGIASSDIQFGDAPFIADIAPGESLSHNVTITTPNETEPINFEVMVGGYNQSIKGIPEFIPAIQYKGGFSAIDMIGATPTNFVVEPNLSAVVTIKADMPSNADAGTKYAIVLIRSIPNKGNETVSASFALNSRVQLTAKGSNLIRTGEITSIKLDPDGDATLTLKNTGNTDFKAFVEAEVLDENGRVKAHKSTSFEPVFGIMPTYSYEFAIPFDVGDKLTSGTYTINATVKLEDGTVIAAKKEAILIK
jgi:hypothetical protein